MKIDINYEKWLGEEKEVTNGTLGAWAHYIKITRRKIVDMAENDREKEMWNNFLLGLENEVKSYVSPKPEPKIVETNEVLKRP